MTFLVLASLIFLGEPFTEVEVRGNVLVPTETFLHHLGTPDHATLPAAIQRLFDTGLFEDIRFETETTPSEFRLIVLIDDSIVRGTTSRKIVGMVRHAGAKEIHLRISSLPTTGPCHYGIDTPKREELIAATHSVAEIARFVGADSVGYLSQEGLLSAVAEDRNRYCSACFSGNYPVPLPEEGRDQLKLFEKVRE